MANSEFKNSAAENKNDRTEESETSNDEYFSDFTKLQPHMYKLCVSKTSVKDNCSGKESSSSEEDTSKIENTR